MTEQQLRENCESMAPAGCAKSVAVLALFARFKQASDEVWEFCRAVRQLEEATTDDEERAAMIELHAIRAGNGYAALGGPSVLEFHIRQQERLAARIAELEAMHANRLEG